MNSAAEVIADVKDDEEIGYRPLDDPEEAIEGVRSGRFYAAVIFEDGFTYDMHHFEEAINSKYLKAMLSQYFSDTGKAFEDIDSQEACR